MIVALSDLSMSSSFWNRTSGITKFVVGCLSISFLRIVAQMSSLGC